MMVLVLGKNNSGKSLYAETLACALRKGKLYYIATMIPYGEEGLNRVERHRIQRQGKGFITMESPYLDIVTDSAGTVLLEDISNLAANLMFEMRTADAGRETLFRIKNLSENCENLIMVSISGYTQSEGDNNETKEYIRLLSAINSYLWKAADVVIEMVSHEPMLRKGEKTWEH